MRKLLRQLRGDHAGDYDGSGGAGGPYTFRATDPDDLAFQSVRLLP